VESARRNAPGRPLVLTEIGSSATPAWGGGVDEATQARQILNALMDAARTPTSATYIYELIDSRNKGPADEQSHYGLFRWDGTPRPAATAVHNLTEILGVTASPGGVGAPVSPDYSIRGVPQWGGDLLFQRDDGAKLIAVWAEPDIWDEKTKAPIPPPRALVSIELAKAAHVAIYDPLQARAPVQTLGTASRVTLTITDHPLIVELTNPR
jgi:hypothetical protein